ncbi:hypothetical protein B0T17DRAFT_504967 [Bombardia bombarda]|uniref:Uncharacterized protein n=1 Tax=Bombardia bombarda TaxID=252184 RepID=A0AA39X703_9PEZI|nr:hypothetical protein B0T17DRAFT_504967 [Bombardia bombarda]
MDSRASFRPSGREGWRCAIWVTLEIVPAAQDLNPAVSILGRPAVLSAIPLGLVLGPLCSESIGLNGAEVCMCGDDRAMPGREVKTHACLFSAGRPPSHRTAHADVLARQVEAALQLLHLPAAVHNGVNVSADGVDGTTFPRGGNGVVHRVAVEPCARVRRKLVRKVDGAEEDHADRPAASQIVGATSRKRTRHVDAQDGTDSANSGMSSPKCRRESSPADADADETPRPVNIVTPTSSYVNSLAIEWPRLPARQHSPTKASSHSGPPTKPTTIPRQARDDSPLCLP